MFSFEYNAIYDKLQKVVLVKFLAILWVNYFGGHESAHVFKYVSTIK